MSARARSRARSSSGEAKRVQVTSRDHKDLLHSTAAPASAGPRPPLGGIPRQCRGSYLPGPPSGTGVLSGRGARGPQQERRNSSFPRSVEDLGFAPLRGRASARPGGLSTSNEKVMGNPLKTPTPRLCAGGGYTLWQWHAQLLAQSSSSVVQRPAVFL
jgi:hypothetical protein